MLSSNDYSFIDRLLHRVAFGLPMLQVALGDMEGDIFRKRLEGVAPGGEVFVTGLPRAGTTLVMTLLHETGEFGSFTYRHMPFILAPMLWDRMTRGSRREAVAQERAHGDGMAVSFDSPEAFEEIIWLAHRRKLIVAGDRLRPLGRGDLDRDFADALRGNVRRLLAVVQDAAGEAGPRRYLSKNNANISRLAALHAMFPQARILVVFRHPLAHVSSLMNQHERFLDRHAADGFARAYMRWLGHYEFGENFKPIDFDGWLGDGAVPARPDQDWWLCYWTAAYRHALAAREALGGRGGPVTFVDYDALLADGHAALSSLAGAVALREPERLVDRAATLRSPTTRPVEGGDCSAGVLDEAARVHEALRGVAG
jgi:hypothetical protein